MSSSRNFFPSKMTKCYVHSRPGLSSHCCSSWLPGSEVPNNALCDSSPRPLPVCRRSEGDRQGQQNLPESERPLCGLWGDSRKVCHGPETNDLEFMESLLIQIIANFFQSQIYGLSVPFVHAPGFIQFWLFRIKSVWVIGEERAFIST